MITCKALAEYLETDRVREAGLWTRLQLRLHLLMCPACVQLGRQVKAIREVARRAFPITHKEQSRLEERILSRLTRD